jgi:leucyl aminopeptidase
LRKAVLIDDALSASAIPIHLVTPDSLEATARSLQPPAQKFLAGLSFKAGPASVALLPDGEGGLAAVLLGLGMESGLLSAGKLASALPAGTYRLAEGTADPALAALAFALGSYAFARYRKEKEPEGEVRLVVPSGIDGAELRRMVAAIMLARDLINTPANALGPAEVAAAIASAGRERGATVRAVEGLALVEGFPLVHAVGAAASSDRAPRLVDLSWGDPADPKVTLVGKGVCFDTGGLDIKPSAGMLLMKKDMGGAANALALATLIMDAKLPVRLRLLVPTVENAISGGAMRPGDVFTSRKGLTVEIGNTDAEGRLILADALALASEEKPDLLVDFATLTGAARVALGPELPALFTASDELAAELSRHAVAVSDPLWRLPLWMPYMAMLDSKVADINNAGAGGFAGAITAALFLSRFVEDQRSWLHIDLFAWNHSSKPGRPEGGEAQTIRALYAMLKDRYPRR